MEGVDVDVRRSALSCYQVCRLVVGNCPKRRPEWAMGIIKEQRPARDHPQCKGLTSCSLFLGVVSRGWKQRPTPTCSGTWKGGRGVTYVVQGRVWGSMGFFLAGPCLAQA